MQVAPLYVNVLQEAKDPAYALHTVDGSTHPAPLVTQPVRKVLHSALVFSVLSA